MKCVKHSAHTCSCGIATHILAALGSLAARVEGAAMSIGVIRVTFWGAIAMSLAAAVGRLFGIAV
ncbi:hypothetical protein [Nitrosomonas sp. Nm34]|uniref:hypothetical protein n=1 Tax=Nitrosomonas sp. Nm34 TaxID=1881055 RepID=UPI0008E8AB2B|nr:hypothetical protein SAMN05428978_10793 [Nitrosomonas sp. Nm34]